MLPDQTHFKRWIDIGIALSAEKDINKLMERILLEAKDLGNADGGRCHRETGGQDDVCNDQWIEPFCSHYIWRPVFQ